MFLYKSVKYLCTLLEDTLLNDYKTMNIKLYNNLTYENVSVRVY